MIEEDWKQQVCAKKDAIRVDFYFALVALLAILPTFIFAKDWLIMPLFLCFTYLVELVASLFRFPKRTEFENFWREALAELRNNNTKTALLLFRDYMTDESLNSIDETRK